MNIDNMPTMMTVRQVAKTGLLPENTLRVMLKRGELPAVFSGTTAYVNFDILCNQLRNLKPNKIA